MRRHDDALAAAADRPSRPARARRRRGRRRADGRSSSVDAARLVDEPAARGIDQDAPRFIAAKAAASISRFRFRRQRQVQRRGRRRSAASRKGQRTVLATSAAGRAAGVDDRRAELPQHRHQAPGDIAETDQPDGAPGQLAETVDQRRVERQPVPARVRRSSSASWRNVASISSSVISATAWVLVPGILQTAIPRAFGGLEIDRVDADADLLDQPERWRGIDTSAATGSSTCSRTRHRASRAGTRLRRSPRQ